MKKSDVLIIDGDILNFTIGRVTEDISDFGDQVCSSFSETYTIKLLEDGIKSIADKCGYDVSNVIFAMSCSKNYRKRFFPTYKGNRKDVVKPLGLEFLRKHIIDNAEKYNLLMLEELEADDAMGICGTSGDTSISIYSQDKDLRTIPVRQWDFKKEKFWTPTYDQAMKWLYTQVLTGDTVDGYRGCPKIGKVKAELALRDCKNDLELVEQSFVRYYAAYKRDVDIAKEEYLKQIGQARILHQSDYLELKQFDRTFNPFSILNIDNETLKQWGENYVEKLEIIKRDKLKSTSLKRKVKDAI